MLYVVINNDNNPDIIDSNKVKCIEECHHLVTGEIIEMLIVYDLNGTQMRVLNGYETKVNLYTVLGKYNNMLELLRAGFAWRIK